MVIAGSWSARRNHWPGAWFSAWLLLRRSARVSGVARAHLNEATPQPEPAPASVAGNDPAQAFPDFEAFFRAHQRDISGYLWRMTGDEQAAYDLSQETFVRAWQHFDRIASYERPGAWLFRVATNLALTHLRRAAAPLGAAQPFASGLDPSVSDPSWRLAESDAVRATLLALPPQQRAALALREVYGFSCAEVAEALGVSLAAAKMTLSRGREAFRARYTQEEEQP
jgi:RNA polymerase sigma-70 factor (ECF subfamily)